MKIAIVHDSLASGDAAAVVRGMLGAYPEASVHTALTADGSPVHAHARRADDQSEQSMPPGGEHLPLPLLAPAFSTLHVDADLTLVSSTGWAHGVRTTGRKIVYSHAPRRWRVGVERGARPSGPRDSRRARYLVARPRIPRMAAWDRAALRTAERVLVTSAALRTEIERSYGVAVHVLPPPAGVDADRSRVPVPGIAPGYVLCVEPLLEHRNLDVIVDAMRMLPDARLVVAGDGPLHGCLDDMAGRNVTFVRDAEPWHVRWLYANAAVVVGASFAHFAAGPVEAAAHGVPFVAPRRGAYTDTVRHGVSGLLFDQVDDRSIAAAVRAALGCSWDANALGRHAERFGEAQFITSLRALATERTAPVQQQLPLLRIAS